MEKKSFKFGSYQKHIDAIEMAISYGDMESACADLKHMIIGVSRREGSDMGIIPVPVLDAFFEKIGKIFTGESSTEKNIPESGEGIVFLTSSVFKTGGHSREIEDWVANLSGKVPVKVVIAARNDFSDAGTIVRLKEKVGVLTSNHTGFEDSICWIVKTIEKENPATLVISPSADDVSLFVALSILKIRGVKVLNLNLDHGISPGLFLQSIDKVLVRRIFLITLLKDKYGLENLIYRPLIRSKTSSTDDYSPSFGRGVVSFSCTSSAQKITPLYGEPFDEVISSMIIRCGSKHIHVGAISSFSLAKIRSALLAADMEDRFIHLEYAANLIDVFRDYEINTLIQTFPVGGGLVTLDAMRAGLMVVNHLCYKSHQHNYMDFCYEGSIVWMDREDLYDRLSSVTAEEFAVHTVKSKECFRSATVNSNIEEMLLTRNFSSSPYDSDFFRRAYSYPLDLFRIQFEAPPRVKPHNSISVKVRRELRRVLRKVIKRQ